MEDHQSECSIDEQLSIEGSDDEIGEHLSFLDNLSCSVSDPPGPASYVNHQSDDAPIISKKTIKMYQKLIKKCKKLVR